jgi:hypothetical protein
MKLKWTIVWTNKSMYRETDECLDLETVLSAFFTIYTLSTVLCAVYSINFSTEVLIQTFIKLGMDDLLRFRETS